MRFHSIPRFRQVLAAAALLATTGHQSIGATVARADLFVRDPFILPVAESHTYFLYTSSTAAEPKSDLPRGVVAYQSTDLTNWTGPTRVFTVPSDGWADPRGDVWAPEVHVFNGRYYLFVTLANATARFLDQPGRPPLHARGTSIFVADSPTGPFLPLAREPQTPANWMSLDGTLFVEDGRPWMVFCHEWFQTIDGTYELVPLTPDLARPAAPPVTLFSASEIPWTRDMKSLGIEARGHAYAGYVSDGCFLRRTKAGTLLMLTSSFSDTRYSLGLSRSTSGRLAGPWVHEAEPLFRDNGGHGMLFTTFDGRLVLSLHAPNDDARCRLFEVEETTDSLRLGPELP